ncbi:NAD-dependent epimerase/dehydratase family protein [Streptosporangium soli]|nr:NAD-dependent epimerase/dehydratase [Streptosporangium sp. KLBMP 9127]
MLESNALAEIDRHLYDPPESVVADLAELPGDLILLGAAGKLGFSLSRMAVLAAERGRSRRVIAVSRFSEAGRRAEFEAAGIEVVAADLSREAELAALPDAANVVYLVGRKFGTTGDPWTTWQLNTYLPGRVAERYAGSRIVAFSTGNVYPLTAPSSGGATEDTEPAPVGEYAQSCLGRERILQHFSVANGTPISILRLNYAIDLRYGVLHDIATKVWAGDEVDVTMGSANVIWQGDANAVTLRSLAHCASPADILNLTGPETVSTRWLAGEFARRFGVEPRITGTEAPTALLSNAARCTARFGYPSVPLLQMIDWTATWIAEGGPSIGKPTHFEQRAGAF